MVLMLAKYTEENGIIETTEYEYDGLKRLTQESVAKLVTVQIPMHTSMTITVTVLK